MKGKEQLAILRDIAETVLPVTDMLANNCKNFPGNKEVSSDILCPFRNVVNPITNCKSLGCSYYTEK